MYAFSTPPMAFDVQQKWKKKNLNQEHIEIPVHMDSHLTVAQINISIKALCFSQPQLASNDHNYFYSIFAAGLRF